VEVFYPFIWALVTGRSSVRLPWGCLPFFLLVLLGEEEEKKKSQVIYFAG